MAGRAARGGRPGSGRSAQVKRVLITGAAGRIGRSLAGQLGDRYALRLMYHRSVPPEHEAGAAQARETGQPVAVGSVEVTVGDTGDLESLQRACQGMDA